MLRTQASGKLALPMPLLIHHLHKVSQSNQAAGSCPGSLRKTALQDRLIEPASALPGYRDYVPQPTAAMLHGIESPPHSICVPGSHTCLVHTPA